MSYQCLLLATGARPVKPQVNDLDLRGIFYLCTYADAVNLAAMAGESWGDEVYTYGPRERLYRRLVFRDERLVSAVFTGEVEKSGIYTRLIRSGRPVTNALREKLVDMTVSVADLALKV